MDVLWLVIGATAVVFAGVRAWLRSQGPTDTALGTVSDHWLAEQRMNRPDGR